MKIIATILLLTIYVSQAWGVILVRTSAGGGTTYFYQDTFTEASNTALASHTPDTGSGSYTQRDDDTMTVTASTDTLDVSGTVSDMFRYSVSPADADYTVQVIFEYDSDTTGNVQACARVSATFSAYCARFAWNTDDHYLNIAEVTNGSYSNGAGELVSGTSSGTDYCLEIEVDGSNIYTAVYSDTGCSTSIATKNASDSSITAAGAPGGYLYTEDYRMTEIRAID